MSADQRPDIAEELGTNALFLDLPPEAVARIGALGIREACYRGQTIIEEGEEGNDLLLLLSGRVGIQIESISPYVEVGINKLDAGDVIGEMAIIDPAPRSATVVALEACEIFRVPSEPLLDLFASEPAWGMLFMRNLASILSGRLRMMNRRILNLIRARYF